MSEKRIICFGDSNTWGYDAETGGRFDENTRYPKVLQKLLGAEFDIVEEGLCGRTTVFEDPINEGLKGLDYLLPCLQTHNPVYCLIIMLGTNDCKERFSATPRNIADGLRRLIIKARTAEVWEDKPNILIIAPGPIEKECETAPGGDGMGVCSDRSYGLAKYYEERAKEFGCKFLDAGKIVTMNKIDYMHLDAESHKRLAKEVAVLIRS